MINCYNNIQSFTEDKYKEEIGKRLGIANINDIHIFNKPAKDFFNEDLNIEIFSSLFQDSSEEVEVLPE